MIGSDVTNVKIGDKVIIMQSLGCCCRFIKVKARHVKTIINLVL